jgi:tetratricopeptide (TPR) repeat protein
MGRQMADEQIRKKLERLSDAYYNRGLDRAQIRDLSGAANMLRTSLQLNKRNIQARNLLGLVYFEMGEAVAALSEWVISKNLREEDNIAGEFIEKLKANQSRLSSINESIKGYNLALQQCRGNDEDVAAITLRKVVSQNPKFIKAQHLLALIYIRNGRYQRARNLLRKALKIDRTNSTTLRYMKEIEEKTGSAARLSRKEKRAMSEREIDATVVQPLRYRQSSPMIGLVNIVIGIAVGILAAMFLVAPAVRRQTNTEANRKIVEYSNTMATQENQIQTLQKQVDESNSTVDSAKQQIETANQAATSYENLLKAYIAYQNGSYTSAAQTLESVNSETLSSDAKETYDTVYNAVETIMFKQLKNSGMEAFDRENYQEAITSLEKAMEINSKDYTTLDYLALAYRANGDTQKAIETFEKIVELFPDTRRATSAQAYIDQLSGSSQSSDTAGTEETDETDNNETDEE